MAATEGWRGRRAGRWCSRFLLVLGGAVAGTAAAWAVTTSGAAASTEPDDNLITNIAAEVRSHTTDSDSDTRDKDATAASASPATDAVVEGADELTSGATDAGADVLAQACDGPVVPREADDASQDRREARDISETSDASDASETSDASDISEVTEATTTAAGEVRTAICDFTERSAAQSAHRLLNSVEQVVRDPRETRSVVERTLTPSQEVQDFAHNVLGMLHPRTGGDLIDQLPALPALPGDGSGQPASPAPDQVAPEHTSSGTGSPEIFTVEIPPAALDAIGSAVDVRHSIGDSADDARGTGDDREGKTPVQPVRIPLAPITAPTVPGGTHGGGHLDGTTFGVPAGAYAASDDIVIGEIRSGMRHLQVSPGSQPGVTPD
ncbi:hypothetical protein [Amycolatopsis palatopharyngis]|uniref:hypothetical protein n=1 Tax=Amycolatopsis palatopharyngis TaxID=187982 RepID=UPI0013BE9DF3|nr:hypothetical protein [Amycolatopsis palatopharyngis]